MPEATESAAAPQRPPRVVIVTGYENVRLGGQRSGKNPAVIPIAHLDCAWLFRLREDIESAEHRFGGSDALFRKFELGLQDAPELSCP